MRLPDDYEDHGGGLTPTVISAIVAVTIFVAVILTVVLIMNRQPTSHQQNNTAAQTENVQQAGNNQTDKYPDTQNLITGTRYLNTQGMLPFETKVCDYIKNTGNHVLYRVTPIFDGDNLLADGVLMEAYSVEDAGEGIQFCVFAYNVQPGIGIDYATGDNWAESNAASQEAAAPIVIETPTQQPQTDTTVQITPEPSVPQESQETTYVLNTNTMKFHYPSCSSVDQMKEKNKEIYTGNREDIINMGYMPCKRCNP